MATCTRCGTIMPGTPGAKCPACGVVSIPAAQRAPAQPRLDPGPRGSGPGAQSMDAALERMKAIARRIDARTQRPSPGMPGPMPMTALGLNLAIYGVLAFLAAVVSASVGAQWPSGAAGALASLLNGLSLLLVIGGVVLIGYGLGFTFVPIALAAIAMFIPLVNVIVLLLVVARALRALRATGWRVGFMGAKRPPKP